MYKVYSVYPRRIGSIIVVFRVLFDTARGREREREREREIGH